VSLDSYANLQTAVGAELARPISRHSCPIHHAVRAKARRGPTRLVSHDHPLTNVTGDTVLAATVSDVLSVARNDGTSGAHNFHSISFRERDYQRWMESESIQVRPLDNSAT